MAHVESYRLRDGRRRYRARWVGVDGRPRSRSFALKKDVDRFVLEQQRRASLGALYQAPPETLGDFLAGWLERYALRVRPSSLARVRDVLPHLDVFRSLPLDEIHPAAVEDHVAALARRAPRQAELALRVLKQVLANAKERGHVVDDGVSASRRRGATSRRCGSSTGTRSRSSPRTPTRPTATSSCWRRSPGSGRASCSRSATATSTSTR